MKNLEEIINEDIKKILSQHRYEHSIGVMKMAEKLAKLYGADENKARIVGLAHDIAKQFSDEQNEKYLKEYGIELDEIEKTRTGLIHSKIGAEYCKRKYGFDEQMVKAVLYHTTGNPDMDLLAKIIYVADKIEENRDYEEIEERRKIAFENLDNAIIETINYEMIECVKKNNVIHINSIKTRNKLILNLEN
jgi:predicted HD superfamily hydrolase involved in NAD metabolism